MKYEIETKAKINLSLDVIGKRADGYHELEMIMHTVNLYDTITFFETAKKAIILTSDCPLIPTDDRNIIIKACNIFFERIPMSGGGFSINLHKTIPVCAGLAGGSSNAAGVLKFLNKYYGNLLTIEELMEMGKKIGADVPYCLLGGTYFAEGIGEKLTELPGLPPCIIVIVKPPDNGLSTQKIFSMVDISKIQRRPDTTGIIKALNAKDLHGVCEKLYNVLEEYSAKECPQIKMFKNVLLQNGALAALMTGSGNAVYGIFDDIEGARQAHRLLNVISNAFILRQG